MFSKSELQEIVKTFTGKELITGDSTKPVCYNMYQLSLLDNSSQDTVYYIGDLQGIFGQTEYIELSRRKTALINEPSFGFSGAQEADGSEQEGLTNMGLCHVNQFVFFSCVDAINAVADNNQITFRGFRIEVEPTI